jgi:hypothetical protein
VSDPIVPSVGSVLLDLLPAFVVGLIEQVLGDALALLRELLADLLTFTTGDVTP